MLGIEIGPRLRDEAGQGQLPGYNITNLTLSAMQLMKYIELAFNIYKQYEHPALLSDLGSFYLNAQYPVYDIPADTISFRLQLTANF